MDLIRWGILLDVGEKHGVCVIYNPAANITPHHIIASYPPEEFFFESRLIGIGPTNNEYR